MADKIYAPNIHLFAFHLQENVDPNKKNWLWEAGEEIIHKTLQPTFQMSEWIDADKKTEASKSALIRGEKVENDNFLIPLDGHVTVPNHQPLGITGFAYPIKLFDSVGLWLNIRRPEKENGTPTEDLEPEFLRLLNPDNCFTLEESKSFLGDTLLITAWLTDAQNNQDWQTLKRIADNCITAFFPPDSIPPFNRSGQLFGSPIFEYGLFSQLANYRHVLVWLFANSEADEKLNQCQDELLDLLFFRTKVVKAYQESQKIYDETNGTYGEIEAEIRSLKDIGLDKRLTEAELENYKNKLRKLPQIALNYANRMRFLEDYQNTIDIHARNYTRILLQIRSNFNNADISFLETFSQENCPFFRDQIKFDLGYLNHGSGLLDKAIASIRARLAIDQAELDRDVQTRLQEKEAEEKVKQQQREAKDKKRDRQLQMNILAVGSGIGAASILASSYPLITQEPLQPPFSTPTPHPFIQSIFWSLMFGVVVGTCIWFTPRIWGRFKRPKP